MNEKKSTPTIRGTEQYIPKVKQGAEASSRPAMRGELRQETPTPPAKKTGEATKEKS